MDNHVLKSNILNEEVTNLDNKVQEWCNNINNSIANNMGDFENNMNVNLNFIREGKVRIDGLQKRIGDSKELFEIRRAMESEQEQYQKYLNTNLQNMLEKVQKLEMCIAEDRNRLEGEKVAYENDLHIAKIQSSEREKSCRIYSDNLGLYINKVNGNNRFTFIYIDVNNPLREFYFDLYYNEKTLSYNGVHCEPYIHEFQDLTNKLNNKSICLRKFISNMRQAFKNSL
ncbi:hypothetical protein ACR3K2_33900 [Cryptosporidium serpentis]